MIKLFEKNSSPWRHFSSRKSISNLIKSCLEVKFWTLGGIIPLVWNRVHFIYCPHTRNQPCLDRLKWSWSWWSSCRGLSIIDRICIGCAENTIKNICRSTKLLMDIQVFINTVFIMKVVSDGSYPYKGFKIQVRWWKHP